MYSEAVEHGHVRGKKRALGLYTKLLRKYPDSPEALHNKGVILCEEKGRHDNALAHFQKAHELRPDDAELLYSIGLEMAHLHKYKKSKEYYEKCLQVNPNNVSALVNLAAATVSGNPVKSMKLIRKALKIEPHHEIALKNREIIMSKLKKKWAKK